MKITVRFRKSNLFFIGKGFAKIIDACVLIFTLGFYNYNAEERYGNSKVFE